MASDIHTGVFVGFSLEVEILAEIIFVGSLKALHVHK